MLVRLYWHNETDPDRSHWQFVAEGDFGSHEAMRVWLVDMIDKHGKSRPDGWIPLIEDATHEVPPVEIKGRRRLSLVGQVYTAPS